MLRLLPVPRLLRSEGLLLNPELFMLDPSLLFVLSALLLMLALSVWSGGGSVKEGAVVGPDDDV